MAEELKKEQDSTTVLERIKKNMETTVRGTCLSFCPPGYHTGHLSVFLSTCLHISILSTCLSFCLPVCHTVYLSPYCLSV